MIDVGFFHGLKYSPFIQLNYRIVIYIKFHIAKFQQHLLLLRGLRTFKGVTHISATRWPTANFHISILNGSSLR